MALETRKVIAFQDMINDANLSGKEITALFEDLAVDNYVPGSPFEVIVGITKDNEGDYENHWKKILNMLINQHQCQYNEKVIVVESL